MLLYYVIMTLENLSFLFLSMINFSDNDYTVFFVNCYFKPRIKNSFSIFCTFQPYLASSSSSPFIPPFNLAFHPCLSSLPFILAFCPRLSSSPFFLAFLPRLSSSAFILAFQPRLLASLFKK